MPVEEPERAQFGVPESSQLVRRGKTWFQRGFVNTPPYHAQASHKQQARKVKTMYF